MLIHPWDAAVNSQEWQDWLATVENFGVQVRDAAREISRRLTGRSAQG